MRRSFNSLSNSLTEDLTNLFEQNNQESFLQREHKKLMIDYLIEQFSFDQDLAWMIVELNDCSNMAETVNLFTTGEDDFYEHLFIPENFIVSRTRNKEPLQQNLIEEKIRIEDQVSVQNEQPKQKKEGKKFLQCRVCGEGIEKHSKFLSQENSKAVLEIQFEKFLKKKDEEETMNLKTYQMRKSMSEEDIDESYSLDPLLFKKYSSKEEKIEEKRSQMCEICYTNYMKSQITSINGILHPICFFCMNEYLKEEIINRRIQNIGCPHCNQPLSHEFIKGIVSNVIFEKYETFLRNNEIQSNPNLRWCPNPKCSIVIHSKQNKKKLVCPKCSFEICGKCNREYHPKQSCDSVFDKQIKGLQNAKDIQKCRKCKALVEKISGCNHMTCTVCRYEWCWLCGSTYSYVHFSPMNPLGCAGLQNGHHSRWGKCKIYLLRILIMISIIVLSPIVIPLVMVLCGPGILIALIWDKCCRHAPCCLKFLLSIISLPLGFAMDPFVWIWAIIYFTPRLCSQMCDWIERRRQIHTNSENNLRRRLIQQGDVMGAD